MNNIFKYVYLRRIQKVNANAMKKNLIILFLSISILSFGEKQQIRVIPENQVKLLMDSITQVSVRVRNLTVTFENTVKKLQQINDQDTKTIENEKGLIEGFHVIFVIVTLLVIFITVLIPFLIYFLELKPAQKAFAEFDALKKQTDTYKENIIKLTEKYKETRRHALRALYEGNLFSEWKIIHHIRYCEVFFDEGNYKDLFVRLKALKNEFEALKKEDPKKVEFINKFENSEGLRLILGKIIQAEDKNVRTLASKILSEYLLLDNPQTD